jgi:hypothetical protein
MDLKKQVTDIGMTGCTGTFFIKMIPGQIIKIFQVKINILC